MLPLRLKLSKIQQLQEDSIKQPSSKLCKSNTELCRCKTNNKRSKCGKIWVIIQLKFTSRSHLWATKPNHICSSILSKCQVRCSIHSNSLCRHLHIPREVKADTLLWLSINSSVGSPNNRLSILDITLSNNSTHHLAAIKGIKAKVLNDQID